MSDKKVFYKLKTNGYYQTSEIYLHWKKRWFKLGKHSFRKNETTTTTIRKFLLVGNYKSETLDAMALLGKDEYGNEFMKRLSKIEAAMEDGLYDVSVAAYMLTDITEDMDMEEVVKWLK